MVVLMFHRVLSDSELAKTHSQEAIVIRRQSFRRLASYVARNYHAVAAAEAPAVALEEIAGRFHLRRRVERQPVIRIADCASSWHPIDDLYLPGTDQTPKSVLARTGIGTAESGPQAGAPRTDQ